MKMNSITSTKFLAGLIAPKCIIRFCAVVFAAGFAQQAQAQFAVDYSFDTNLLAAVSGTDAAKVTASAFDLRGNGFRSNSWDPADPSLGAVIVSGANTPTAAVASLSSTVYWDFTLSANEGEFLDLNSFTLSIGVNGRPSESHFMLQSSIEGFGSGNPIMTLTPSSVSTPNSNTQWATATVSLSSLYDNVSEATFRVYMYTTSEDAAQYSRLRHVSVSGTVGVIPEPAELSVVIGLGVLGATLLLRRRRKHSA